jgi:hypothetical protein
VKAARWIKKKQKQGGDMENADTLDATVALLAAQTTLVPASVSREWRRAVLATHHETRMSLQRAMDSTDRWAWVAQHCPWTRPGWDGVDRGLDRVHRAALRDDRRGVLEWLAAAGHVPQPTRHAEGAISLRGLVWEMSVDPGACSRQVEFVMDEVRSTTWTCWGLPTGLSCFEFSTPPWYAAVPVERWWALMCDVSASCGEAVLVVDGCCRHLTRRTIVPVPMFEMHCIQIAVLHDEPPTVPVRLTMTVWEMPEGKRQMLNLRASFCGDYDYVHGQLRPIDDLSVTPSRLDRDD